MVGEEKNEILSLNESQGVSKEQLYLKIWEIEQAHSTKRWTITTFFLGMSFAVLGFTFSIRGTQVPLLPQYLAAIISYWFAYILFIRLNSYTQFLRAYLRELENSDAVSFQIQTDTQKFMSKRNFISTTRLLFYFGIIYTIGIIAIAVWLL